MEMIRDIAGVPLKEGTAGKIILEKSGSSAIIPDPNVRRQAIEECISVVNRYCGARSKVVAALNKIRANGYIGPQIPSGYSVPNQEEVEIFLHNRKDIQDFLVAVLPWRKHRFGDAEFVLRVNGGILYAVAQWCGSESDAIAVMTDFWNDMAGVVLTTGWPSRFCLTWEIPSAHIRT